VATISGWGKGSWGQTPWGSDQTNVEVPLGGWGYDGWGTTAWGVGGGVQATGAVGSVTVQTTVDVNVNVTGVSAAQLVRYLSLAMQTSQSQVFKPQVL